MFIVIMCVVVDPTDDEKKALLTDQGIFLLRSIFSKEGGNAVSSLESTFFPFDVYSKCFIFIPDQLKITCF